MSWRAGARLFREIFPLIQRHVPEDDFRAEFVRDLLDFFQRYESEEEGTYRQASVSRYLCNFL